MQHRLDRIREAIAGNQVYLSITLDQFVFSFDPLTGFSVNERDQLKDYLFVIVGLSGDGAKSKYPGYKPVGRAIRRQWQCRVDGGKWKLKDYRTQAL